MFVDNWVIKTDVFCLSYISFILSDTKRHKTTMVISNITSIETLDELQHFVYRTLCQDHELLMNAFPTSEILIRKPDGQGCGVMFCLHGPRTTKFSAIWEQSRNRVLFYGPQGERYQQITLEESSVGALQL